MKALFGLFKRYRKWALERRLEAELLTLLDHMDAAARDAVFWKESACFPFARLKAQEAFLYLETGLQAIQKSYPYCVHIPQVARRLRALSIVLSS